jgi:hypothetical protein
MPDLKTVLTEALREHDIGYQRCKCGWFTEHGVVADAVAAHLADVLLSLPGVAVTQLPEPIGTNGNDNRVWENGPNYIEQEFEGDVIINDRLGIDAEHLRATAAILLAAVVLSEGETR